MSRIKTLWNCLFWFDVRGPDHFVPLLGFLFDQFAKVGWREREHFAADLGKPCLQVLSFRALEHQFEDQTA